MNGNKNEIQVVIKGCGTFGVEKGSGLYSLLRENGLFNISNCGGNGTCGKCVVRFIKGAPIPKPHERKCFSAQMLRDGYRLACVSKPTGDCIIELKMESDDKPVLSGKTFLDPQLSSSVVVHSLPKDYGETYVIADIGTTTIAMQLLEVESQKVIETFTAMNPQRVFGADVISRMQKANEGQQILLSECIQYCIESGLKKWIAVGFKPKQVCISANTVMTHLFMQYDVKELSKHPFTPVTLEKIQFDLLGIDAIFLPGFSAFVGGDIMAGVLCCKEEMQKENIKTALLIDLGTNGELVLMHDKKLYCSATAAGPAFEGGANANVPGSDMIAITAKLLDNQVIDETGLMQDAYFNNGVTVDNVHIRQEDVRSIQIAKAAICAGITILLKKAGISELDVEKVYLAGGFGYRVDTKAAEKIGLIPQGLANKTFAAGNTALAGANLYFNHKNVEKLTADLKANAISINLAEESDFEELYIGSIGF